MGLRISTNIASIAAQRTLSTQQKRMEHAQLALASGSRIVKSGDDAAGLAISQQLKGQTAGIKAARTNAFNASSIIQVAEGGLNEINNIMIRLRELGVQAASDTIGETERGYLNQEAQQLKQESERIARSTKFGDHALLSGHQHNLSYHVGPYGDEKENTVNYMMKADATNDALGVWSIDMSNKKGARASMKVVDDAIHKLGAMRADFGSVESRLQSTVANLDVQYENLSAARSRISDADIAFETSEVTSAQVLQTAAIGALAQANQNGMMAMKLLG